MAKLRPANATDSDFCFELHRRTMGSVIVELFGPWDDDVQKEFHTRWFDPTRVQIIEDEAGRAIGVFDVRDEPDRIYLSRVEILPEHQGYGVGTELIRALLAGRRPVSLHVFAANMRALELYERLGFSVEKEAEGRVAMIARP